MSAAGVLIAILLFFAPPGKKTAPEKGGTPAAPPHVEKLNIEKAGTGDAPELTLTGNFIISPQHFPDDGDASLAVWPPSQQSIGATSVSYRKEGTNFRVIVPYEYPAQATRVTLTLKIRDDEEREHIWRATTALPASPGAANPGNAGAQDGVHQPTPDANHAQKTPDKSTGSSNTQQQPQTPPAQPASSPAGGSWLDTATPFIALAAFVIGIALCFYLFWERGKDRRSNDAEYVTMHNRIEGLSGQVTELRRSIDSPPPQGSPSEAGANPNSEESAANADQRVNLLGSESELNSLLGFLRRGNEVGKKSTRSAGRALNVPPETALAAAANYWIDTGGREFTQISAFVAQAGLTARIYTHSDVGKALQDVSGASYTFEPSEDGGWLWQDIAGSTDAFAVPFDARLFHAGLAPELLNHLFEGMQKYPDGFRFRRIYRACRLRRSSSALNTYQLLEKGQLWLNGKPEPEAPEPPSFQSLPEGERIRRRAGAPASASLAQLLQAFLTRLAEAPGHSEPQNSAPQREVAGLAASLQDLTSKLTGVQRKFEEQTGILEDQKRSISAIQSAVWDLEGAISELKTAVAARVEPAQPQVDIAEIQRLSGEMDELKDVVSKIWDELKALRPPSSSRPVAAERPRPTASPKPAVAAAPEPPRAAAPPADSSVAAVDLPSSSCESLRIPTGWKKIANDAVIADKPGTQLNDAYRARVLRFKNELQKNDPGIEVRVVHLDLQSDGSFAVHDTKETEGGMVDCMGCSSAPASQLAVAWSQKGCSDLGIAIPPGRLDPSTYSGGYPKLIKSMPEEKFSIRSIQTPACLTRIGSASDGLYSVGSPMLVNTTPV